MKPTQIQESKHDYSVIIRSVTEGLQPEFLGILQKCDLNTPTICDYLISMSNEVSSLSNDYKKLTIKVLVYLSKFHSNNKFMDMKNDDVISFLNSLRKNEISDPLHSHISTYNTYLVILIRFFKWLNYPDLGATERPKPPVIDKISRLKRKELSIYKPTDLWNQEDDLLFLKYCPSKRDKCYHAISRDSSCRPHELLKLRIKDVIFKIAGDRQYAEILVNGKTGPRHIPLINCIPYLKDWLDDHPQNGNPFAVLICGFGKSLGRAIRNTSLFSIYDNYKNSVFPKLLDDPNVSSEDKIKIKELLDKTGIHTRYVVTSSANTLEELNQTIAKHNYSSRK